MSVSPEVLLDQPIDMINEHVFNLSKTVPSQLPPSLRRFVDQSDLNRERVVPGKFPRTRPFSEIEDLIRIEDTAVAPSCRIVLRQSLKHLSLQRPTDSRIGRQGPGSKLWSGAMDFGSEVFVDEIEGMDQGGFCWVERVCGA